MNFVFFSPHFPNTGSDFCDRLKKAGATVLGIGDAPYDALEPKLRAALSEYYRIADMENYDLTYRAMGYFIHKWGRIDRFELLNEHWLDLEAGIRTDFNIEGIKLDYVKNIKRKSRMRASFRKSGVQHDSPAQDLRALRGVGVHSQGWLPGRGKAGFRRRRGAHL
ncbi:MAG: hypothetical protein QM744_05565 [Mesorhizobium sp.]